MKQSDSSAINKTESALPLASFILGIISTVFFYVFIFAQLFGLVGIIIGFMSLKQMKKTNDYSNKHLAWVGIALGSVSIFIIIAIFLGTILTLSLLSAGMRGDL